MHEMIKMSDLVFFPMVLIFLSNGGRQGGALKFIKMIINRFFFSVLVIFLKVFRYVKKWLTLELHEMINVSNLVAYPVVFILLCGLQRNVDVLKITKNTQFLDVWVIFPKFMGRLRSDLSVT